MDIKNLMGPASAINVRVHLTLWGIFFKPRKILNTFFHD